MKRIVLLLFIGSMASCLLAQQGKVFENLTLESSILKMKKKYAVYLPPDYETSERYYPVLYLLHGAGGDQAEWIQRGEVARITDNAINNGLASAMIIVMPDASGENRGYANDPAGKWRYEDFFFQEFMPYIEKTYRIRPGKRYRAIAGLSMGGNGTFIYALHHPELFAAACPLSAATFPLTIEGAKELLPKRYPDITDKQIEEYYYRYSIPDLIDRIPEDRKGAVRWYIDCGDDDALDQVYEGNSLIHIAMRKKEIPHEFRIRDGAHTWSYWRSALPSVLGFVFMTN